MEVGESPRDRLFRIVESQHGVFTTKQAVDAGYERKAHTHHVNAGNWIREYRGIYKTYEPSIMKHKVHLQ